MTFHAFAEAVDKLVEHWRDDEGPGRVLPRAALRAIYDQVGEQAVHNLAEAVRQRDEAVARLHRKYLEDAARPPGPGPGAKPRV